MSPSLGTAVLELVTDGSKLKAGLQDAGEHARSWGTKMISLGGNISNGLRPITGALEDVAKQSIDMASAMDESLNKVRVVFGDAAAPIEQWAKSSASSLGISTQKALEAAGTFGNLFTAMGVGRKPAADLSKDVVQLAADIASFNNIKPEEALEKLRAGLVGEVEPLRTVGVNLSVAAVEAYALAHGIGDAKGQMTDAEKITARFGLITEQTANAHGDFARTSDGLANSLRIQKAEQENVQAQLGTALLPLMKEFTKIMTGVIKGFTELSPEIQTVLLVLGGLMLVLGPLLTVLGAITGAFGLLIAAAIPAEGTLLATTIAVGGLNIALGPLLLIIGAIALAIFLFKLAWDNNWGDIQGITERAIDFWMSAFSGIKLFLLNLWRAIIVGIADAVNGVIGVINGFIETYNGLAAKLGLPLLGKIELVTPNLAAVDREIDQVARDRVTRLIAQIAMPVNAQGTTTGMFASGTDHITRGPELFVAGEAGAERVTVTPLSGGSMRAPAGDGGHGHDVVMDGTVVASLVGRRFVLGAARAGGAIG